MAIYYSAKENTFYDNNVNEYIPNHTVEISAEEHINLLNSQMKGFVIKADENGYPISVEIQYSQAELDKQKEDENIAFLTVESERTEDTIRKLQRVVDRNIATEEEQQHFDDLEIYAIELMRVPNQETWPLNLVWPTCPEFFQINKE